MDSFAQLGDFTGSTTPTETEVLTFMEMRSAEVYSWLDEVVETAPGPSGYDTTIDNTKDTGRALERVCREASAVGAAMDALEAAGATDRPARTERVAELGEMYASLKPTVQQAGINYAGTAARTATHISTGEITEPTIVSREREVLPFNETTKW